MGWADGLLLTTTHTDIKLVVVSLVIANSTWRPGMEQSEHELCTCGHLRAVHLGICMVRRCKCSGFYLDPSPVDEMEPVQSPPIPGDCECEYTTHFDGRDGAHPMHRYQETCPETIPVKTLWGTFRMCLDCAKALPGEYKS